MKNRNNEGFLGKDWETILYNIKIGRWRRFLAKIYKQFFRITKNKGKNVLNKDWDYLIVIDACRHDLFEEVYGETNYIISLGSNTMEWRDKTFRDKEYDIVYISGNPHMSKVSMKKSLGGIPFFHLEKVYGYGWDEDLKTIPPEEVTKAALKLLEKWPNKKMIIHYMQPHHPFIGKDKIIVGGLTGERDLDVWDLLERKEIKKKRVWASYKDNLKLVMEEVGKLKEELNGKVVLTSDHGNCMGKYGIYGHAYGLRFKELIKVPWVVLKKNKEREIKGIDT